MTSPTVTPTPAPSVSSTKAPMTFPGTVLTPGSKGSAVLAVQQRLNKLGCGPVLEDGTFGAETQDAVELFQTRFQDTSGAPLKIDGTVGPMTWAALFGAATTPTNATAPSQLLAAVLQFASGEVGMMEDPLESNRGPRIDQYLRAVGLDPAAGSFPWCAAFVYFCFQQAAQTIPKNWVVVGNHDANGLRSSVIHTLLPACAEPGFPVGIPGPDLILS